MYRNVSQPYMVVPYFISLENIGPEKTVYECFVVQPYMVISYFLSLFGTLENSEGSEWNLYECFVIEPSSLTYLCSLVHWKTTKVASGIFMNAL